MGRPLPHCSLIFAMPPRVPSSSIGSPTSVQLAMYPLGGGKTMMALDFAWSLERAHTSAGRVWCVHNDLVCALLNRGAIQSCLCSNRNRRGADRVGHRGIERSMRQRVVHGVIRSGAPRRSRSQQPVLEATPPPAPLHLAEALELGNLNRLKYLVVSPG